MIWCRVFLHFAICSLPFVVFVITSQLEIYLHCCLFLLVIKLTLCNVQFCICWQKTKFQRNCDICGQISVMKWRRLMLCSRVAVGLMTCIAVVGNFSVLFSFWRSTSSESHRQQQTWWYVFLYFNSSILLYLHHILVLCCVLLNNITNSII